MLPVILAYTLTRGRRWPEIFTIAAGIIATLLSFSRGGIVSLLLALFIVAVLCVQSKLTKSIFAAAAITVLIASAAAWRLVAGGIGLVTAGAHHHIEIRGGLGTRRDLWAAAVSLWRAHPLWGIGAGNYELEVGKLLRAPIKTHANSFYLQSLVEGGLPLLGAALFLIYNSIATFLGRARTPLTIAALAGSTALALHFILDLLVFYPKVGMQWMILLGIASADLARSKDQAAS
jgi:O-antigen ligase